MSDTEDGLDEVQISAHLPEDDRQHEPDISAQTLLLAATYVEDARTGWKTSLHFEPNSRNLSYYLAFRSRWVKYLLYLVLAVHLGLALIEQPTITPLRCNYLIPTCIELACVAFYLYRCAHLFSFTSSSWFWRDVKNLAIITVSLLMVLDIVVYVAMTEAGSDVAGIRWSRPLRPLLVINIPESRQVRRAWRSVVRTLPDVAGTGVLFLLNLLLFALMAYKLFSFRRLRYANGEAYFATYQDSLFALYVLVTTANSPDVMMPALNKSPPMFLFFAAFILVSLFLFMNVILAVIYNSYRRHLKSDVQTAVAARRLLMSRAFSLLTRAPGDGGAATGGGVTRATYRQLLAVLRPHYSDALLHVLWRVLDQQQRGQLDEREFYQLADLLNVRVTEVKDRQLLLARLAPAVYNSRASLLLRRAVSHRAFRMFFDGLIVVNAVLIAVNEDAAEWAFLVAFMLEILLKMYTFGFVQFMDRMWNLYDLLVIGGACIISVFRAAAVGAGGAAASNTLVLDVLLLLRVLRLVKLMDSVAAFRVVLRTIASFSRSLVTYGGVLLCVYYFFALVGMELFAGKIRWTPFQPGVASDCGDPRLLHTDFGRLQYCANSFNSILSSLATLLELMVVNQWHVIADGHAAVSSGWARLYFVAFHLSCVVIVLNIFTAFVLEAFILEFTADRTSTESRVHNVIASLGLAYGSKRPSEPTTGVYSTLSEEPDGDHDPPPETPAAPAAAPADSAAAADAGVRFHISHRARSVEVLLQRMFESEAAPTVPEAGATAPQPEAAATAA